MRGPFERRLANRSQSTVQGFGHVSSSLVKLHSVAISSRSRTISSASRGRPGPRFLLPSNFAATNSRYHLRMVSGVAIVATRCQAFRPSSLPSVRQPSALTVRQSEPVLSHLSNSAVFSARWYSITRA